MDTIKTNVKTQNTKPDISVFDNVKKNITLIGVGITLIGR